MSPAALVTGLLLAAAALAALGVAVRARKAVRDAIRRGDLLKKSAQAARARATDLASRLDALKTRASNLHHAIPEPDALEGRLPLRLAGAVVRALEPEALTREARFKAASPAYTAARIAAAPDPAVARAMPLQGLTW